MSYRAFTLKADGDLKAAIGRAALTHYHLFDSVGELADAAMRIGSVKQSADAWSGGLSAAESVRRCHVGDLSRVEASDRLMSRFERFGFAAPRRAWVNDVTGAIPDVPAFLAGHPLAMRRRVKLQDDAAPLTVICDLTTSGSVPTEAIERRGAAILALVRILSARRPVELWAGTGTDASDRGASLAFARIDTAPLDLARAAFVMVGASFPRQLCYGLSRKDGYSGSWPYNSHTVSRHHMPLMLAPAFPGSELLCIPAAHQDDDMHRNPEAWIEAKLAALDAAEADAA